MKLTRRPYQDQRDYWRVRDFLRQVFRLNQPHELSWQVYRFDYWRWHVHENIFQFPLEEIVFLWETAEGQIAAVLNPEEKGQAHLQVHPTFRTPGLEEEMLAVAEAHLTAPGPGGRPRLRAWAHAQDGSRREILIRRGYVKDERPNTVEHQRRRPLSAPIPEAPVAPGYTVRALGGRDELPARSWVSWRAFHPDEPDDAYEGWDWYPNVGRAPLYRRELDLVAVAPNGEFASFCTVWFDDVNRSGAFEPVGTAPEHQRLGLGKAVMSEGLRRLRRRGATMAYVGSTAPPAHALYASVGFTEYLLYEPWTKEL